MMVEAHQYVRPNEIIRQGTVLCLIVGTRLAVSVSYAQPHGRGNSSLTEKQKICIKRLNVLALRRPYMFYIGLL